VADIQPPPDVVAAMQRTKSYFPFRHVWAVHQPGQVPEWETYAKTTRHLMLKQARNGKTVFYLEPAKVTP
jgi:hypothetical protein